VISLKVILQHRCCFNSNASITLLVQDKELDVDPDFTSRLISASGGFSSNVRENIVSHPVVVKNRVDPTNTTHISTESRQVMRKGFDLGISSPGLRMLYDVRIVHLSTSPTVHLALRRD